MGEVAQDKLSFLPNAFFGILHADKNIKYRKHFYQHELGEALILNKLINITIQNKLIVGWIVIKEEQLIKLNLGNVKDPKNVLISSTLSSHFVKGVEALLQKITKMYLLGVIRNWGEFQGKFVNIKLN
jgi:hypothetical protein